MSTNQRPQLQITLPDERADGVFADFANIWHTTNVFVLDFVSMTGPAQPAPEDSNEPPSIPCKVVSRIRIPPEQVFELARALTQQLEYWETESGRKPPVAPLFDQDGFHFRPGDDAPGN